MFYYFWYHLSSTIYGAEMIADFDFQCNIWNLIQHYKTHNLVQHLPDTDDHKQSVAEYDDIENKFWSSGSVENMVEIWQYLTFDCYC